MLSLQDNEFVKSLEPRRNDGSWADVYCCDYDEDGVCGCFYVKFIVEGDVATVMPVSYTHLDVYKRQVQQYVDLGFDDTHRAFNLVLSRLAR